MFNIYILLKLLHRSGVGIKVAEAKFIWCKFYFPAVKLFTSYIFMLWIDFD